MPELVFTTITLKGAECGVLAGTVTVKGSVAAAKEPVNVGEWDVSETIKIWETKQKQHFWNGIENIGQETRLTFNATEASLSGTIKMETSGRQQLERQQIAVFED